MAEENSAFPPEIYDLIIDQLRESKSSLSAAALVGRAWLPRCRLHLFRHVNLDLSHAPVPEIPSQSSSAMVPEMLTQRATAFQHHVSCNSSVGSYARELSLTLNDEDDVAGSIPANMSITNLRLLRLRCSHVTICCLKDTKLAKLLSFIRRNHELQYLSIQSLFIEWSPLNVLLACVAIRASSLRRMFLHDVWRPDWTQASWSPGNVAGSVGFPARRKARCLEELCIMKCESGVVESLLRTFDLMSVRSVVLIGSTTEVYLAVLRACSDKLAQLTLDLSADPRSITNLIPQRDVFEHLMGISVLQLVLTQFSDVPALLQSLLLSIPRNRHQKLKHLHLEFQRSPYAEDLFLDSFLFTLCAFIPSLQRISIHVRYHEGQRCKYGPTRTSNQLLKLFPKMQETGMLSFGPWEAWWEKEIASSRELRALSLCGTY